MMLWPFVLCLLQLMAMNSWCVEKSAKMGQSESKGFRHTNSTTIILTQDATRSYFLQKLKDATPADVPSTKVVVTVHADVNPVKVNFLGYTYGKCTRITYRHVYETKPEGGKCPGVFVHDDLSVELELSQPSNSKEGIDWRISATVYENSIIKDNPELEDVIQRRETSLKRHKTRGRLYALFMSVCLRIRRPTECHIYWHPLDGIIFLGFDSFHRKAAMYQAEWNTIATKAKQRKLHSLYSIRVEYFKKKRGKTMDYFISMLEKMKPVVGPSVPLDKQKKENKHSISFILNDWT